MILFSREILKSEFHVQKINEQIRGFSVSKVQHSGVRMETETPSPGASSPATQDFKLDP